MKLVMRTLTGLGFLTICLALPAMGQTLSISANTMSAFSLVGDPTPEQMLTVTTTVGGFIFFIPQTSVCAYMTQDMNGSPSNSGAIPNDSVQLNRSSIVTGGANCNVSTAYLIANHPSGFCFCASKTYSDSVNVRIANYPTTLEADTYQGTITLVATAQ